MYCPLDVYYFGKSLISRHAKYGEAKISFFLKNLTNTIFPIKTS